MSSKSSHRSPNLFVVKGTETQPRVTGVEELSKEQRELLETYKRVSSSEGVLVGAVHGKEPWDLRPLLLAQGKISVVRFSDPSLSGFPELNAQFSSLLRVLKVEKNITAAITVGHANNQHWVRRVWFDETLESLIDANGDLPDPEVFMRSLVMEVERLHSVGLPHGHICPSNIALVQGFPCVFDFGFLAATPASSAPNCAPEIQAGAFASEASDIYGIGLVIRSLLGHKLNPQISAFLDRMTAADPKQRPSLSEVKALVHIPETPRPAAPSRSLSGDTSLTHTAGTVIAPPGAIIGEPVHTSETPHSAPIKPTVPVHTSRGMAAPVGQAGAGLKLTGTQAFILGLLAALAVLGLSRLRDFSFFKSSAEVELEYQQHWNSGQASRRKIVAEAAMEDDDQYAQAVVVSALREGGNKVIADLLRIAFDPRWEELLSETDRRAILGIALEKAINYQVTDFPPLDSLHPGAILAVVASISVESQGKQFEAVSLSRMAQLPGEIGNAFGMLAAAGIEHMEQLPAKGLSHLIAGDVSRSAIDAYFYKCGEAPQCLVRLSAILPLPSIKAGAETAIYTRLPIVAPQLAPLLTWFDDGDWSSVKTGEKLQLLVGTVPLGRSFEQMSDLLRFPLATVRREAVKVLTDVFPSGDMQQFLEAIAAMPREVAITRDQNMLLLIAMRGKGPVGVDQLTQFFGTKPNPQAVLKLLLSRPSVGEKDPFSSEASSYLAHQDWTATTEELRILAKHDELYARALAYSRLKVDVPEELEILRERAEEETNPKMRELIKQRLQTAALIQKSTR